MFLDAAIMDKHQHSLSTRGKFYVTLSFSLIENVHRINFTSLPRFSLTENVITTNILSWKHFALLVPFSYHECMLFIWNIITMSGSFTSREFFHSCVKSYWCLGHFLIVNVCLSSVQQYQCLGHSLLVNFCFSYIQPSRCLKHSLCMNL